MLGNHGKVNIPQYVQTRSTNPKKCLLGQGPTSECENWSRDLNIQNVTKGCLDKKGSLG